MEITSEKIGDILTIRLAGRLDAGWSGAVQKTLDAAIRGGEHRIQLDMEKVDYFSSAGLGVILTAYKELRAINGFFGISKASPFVQSALKLAGLSSLIGAAATAPAAGKARAARSPHGEYEIFPLTGPAMTVSPVGDPEVIRTGSTVEPAVQSFGADTFALGIGALGSSAADCATRYGEFLAVAGMAAFQPGDGSTRPDFVLTQAEYFPEGCLLTGLLARGGFSHLARFEADPNAPTVGLSELAATALDLCGAGAAFLVGAVETAGLVGASLRQSPVPAPGGDRFAFPRIREWISFTGERSHADTTCVIVGTVARDPHFLPAQLRPLDSSLSGHFHAAVFPYRPLQKGRLELPATVKMLFESGTLQNVLHLLPDRREFTGAGESEFLRGALWIAPVQSKIENRESKIP